MLVPGSFWKRTVVTYTLEQSEDFYFITGLNDILPVSSTMLTDLDLQGIPSSDYEVFEPLLLSIHPQQPIQLYRAHNNISFYTWNEQECCLPRDATAATLKDEWVAPPAPVVEVTQQQESPKDSSTSPAKSSKSRRAKQQQEPPEVSSTPPEPPPEPPRKLNLHVGDVLIFEEVLGPKTANPADADPKHRHAVRLTMVEPAVDILYNTPVVEIAWGEEDKLPFPLCLSGIGPAPECQLLKDISIARGNVILVDHGKTISEDLKEEVTYREEHHHVRGRRESRRDRNGGRFIPPAFAAGSNDLPRIASAGCSILPSANP